MDKAALAPRILQECVHRVLLCQLGHFLHEWTEIAQPTVIGSGPAQTKKYTLKDLHKPVVKGL